MASSSASPSTDASTAQAPRRAGIVLTALILGAIVANLNLSVANVALPDIGRSLDASQTELNLIAIGCTLAAVFLKRLGD